MKASALRATGHALESRRSELMSHHFGHRTCIVDLDLGHFLILRSCICGARQAVARVLRQPWALAVHCGGALCECEL